TRPSRFLEDVPRDLLQETDVFGQDVDDSRHLSKFARNVWQPARPQTAEPRGNGELEHGFKGGERVKHPKFGQGTVVGLSGEGARTEITVVFEAAGAKRLLLKYASLSKA